MFWMRIEILGSLSPYHPFEFYSNLDIKDFQFVSLFKRFAFYSAASEYFLNNPKSLINDY